MANNGIYYSSGNTLNFTTNNTTWMNLSSGGTLTVNNIDFDTTPNVPAPTGGTVYFDSNENALSYKPITPSNDVTVNLGQESLIRIYNDLGYQINNGQALHITGATSGSPTVSLAVGTGGDAVQFQISGIATHDIPNLSYGFMTVFGVVRDVNLTGFTVGEQVYLSQTVPGAFASYSDLSFTGRTCEVGHVLDNSASGKLQVTILNEIEGTIITTQENNILAANNSSTGIFEFSGLSITTPSGTTFNVGAVEGWIIDNVTAPANPTIQLIIYTGSTGNTALYVSSATETYILLTSGLTLTQQTTFPTPQQRRQNLYLGKFGHGNRQFLINAFNEPDSALSPVSQLRDMFTAVKLINDGVIASPNAANLNINTSAGVLYGLGIGYVTNKLNPNSLTINSQSPATFQYRTQTGGTAANTTLIDPLNRDVNGVITPITGTKATNQRIYLLQNGQIRVQYGQQEYNQLAAAVAALQNEVFVTFPNFRDNGILIGILSVLSTCNNLSDTTKAQFFSVSKFGELIGAAGGTSTTTLQQAYNNSSEPEITINATLDGFSLKNGTGNADNVSQLLQGINSGGTVTSFIRADGAFSGTSIFGTGLTATTVSATTYLNLPYTGTTNYIPKWTNTTGLTDSQLVDDGTQVYIGTAPTHTGTKFNAGGGVEVGGSLQVIGSASSIGITDTDLSSWTSSGDEIAIGTGSPLASSKGSDNIAIGNGSQSQNDTGIRNVSVGSGTLTSNQAGQQNTAIGHKAGFSVTSGSYNVLIGHGAGYNLETGESNVFLGNDAGFNETGSNKLYIGGGTPLIYGEFDNQIVNINGTLSAATYDNLPLYSAGLLTNSDQWINNNNGTVTLPSAYAALYNQTTYPSVVEVFLISSGTSGTHFPALSNNDTNYIVIDYSGGTPSWNILTDNSTINGETIVLTHIIYRANNFLHVLDFGNEGIALPNKINDRIVAVDRFGRESGFSLGLSASTGVVTLTSGIAWNGTNRQSLVAVNSQDDIFFQVYHTGGTWTYTTTANTLNNLYYDDGTNPVLATGGKYLVNWYFRGQEINDHLYEVWGVDEYDSVSEAQLSTEPNLPELITSHAFLTGRIIVQVSATTGTVESAFVQVFQPSTVQAHNDLTSIQGGQANEYYHLTSSQYNNLSSFKNIQVDGVTQFSSTSLTDNLNFSGINITITSAATNTLVFSAGTGGGGGVTQIVAGTNITISPTGGTGVVTINSTASGGTSSVNLGTVYTTANNFNFL